MVTLAVAVVLLAAGIPLFRGMIANNALVAQTNGLISALNLARSEAVKRGTGVTICAKATADVADTDCGADWSNGWHVFTDGATPNAYDGDDEVLRHWEPAADAAGFTSPVGAIRFESDGSAATVERTIEVAHVGTRNVQNRCIRIRPGGVISVHKVTGDQTCP